MSYIDTAKNYVERTLLAVQDLITYAPFDKTFRAKVIGQESTGKYKVLYKSKEYTVRCDRELLAPNMVWVCAPQNNWNELFIV